MLFHCVVKHIRHSELKSSSNVSLPFSWITGPATDPNCSNKFKTTNFIYLVQHLPQQLNNIYDSILNNFIELILHGSDQFYIREHVLEKKLKIISKCIVKQILLSLIMQLPIFCPFKIGVSGCTFSSKNSFDRYSKLDINITYFAIFNLIAKYWAEIRMLSKL